MLSKKSTIIILAILTCIGAPLMMLSSNMFFGDIVSIGAGISNSTIFATIPATSVTLIAAIAILYIIRLYKRPKTFKSLSRLYLIIALVLSALGFISSILAGLLTYGSLLAPYPFPGYLIIFMIINIILMLSSIGCLLLLHKFAPIDEDKVKITFPYILSTIGWFLFILLMLNRLGMFVTCPFYVYLRTLYKTFVFYIYLLVPLYLGIIKTLNILGILSKKQSLINSIIALSINLVLFIAIVILGSTDTQFISNISPAMPAERISTMPLEIIIHFVSYTAVGVIMLVQAVKKN